MLGAMVAVRADSHEPEPGPSKNEGTTSGLKHGPKSVQPGWLGRPTGLLLLAGT